MRSDRWGIPEPPPSAPSGQRARLAPTGVLRVGINLSNFLLVTGADVAGNPTGVSPSLGMVLGEAIGTPVELKPFPDPGDVVDAIGSGLVDVGNIGADPDRSRQVAFTSPYSEIEATYLVRGESSIASVDDVDRPGTRIVAKRGSAYTLWLDRNITRAELIHTDTVEDGFTRFATEGFEVLAGLRPGLLTDSTRVPGSRVLDGRFTAVEQAIGINRDRGDAAYSYLEQFVLWAIRSGLVARLIAEHQVVGLSVPLRS